MEDGMTWEEALKELGDGNPVYREAWPEQEYLDSRFKSGDDLTEFPHRDARGNAFKILKFNDALGGETDTGTPYAVTEEDAAATDWIRA